MGIPGKAQFVNFTVDNGLPSVEVHDIIQDQQGYIWFATDKGICRFDGYHIKTFTTQDGLVSNVVFDLFEDTRGHIWCTGFAGSISIYNQGEITAYPYNDEIKRLAKRSVPSSIYVDDSTNVLLSLPSQGLLTVDQRGQATFSEKSSENAVNILELADHSLLLVGNLEASPEQATLQFKPKGEAASSYTVYTTEFVNQQFATGTMNDAIVVLGRSVFWKKGSDIIPKQFGGYVFAVLRDADGKVWTGHSQGGLRLYTDASFQHEEHRYLEEFTITSLLRDKQGGLWCSTLEEGVFYLPNSRVLHVHQNNGLISKYIADVDTDRDGNIYVLFQDRLLQTFMQGNWRQYDVFKLHPHNPGSVTNKLLYNDQDQTIWISNGGRLNPHTKKLVSDAEVLESASYFNGITQLDDGHVVMGNSRGIIHKAKGDKTYAIKQLPKKIPIRHLCKLNDKKVLIGNQNGLSMINLDSMCIEEITEEPLKVKAYISQISPWKKGVLIATRGNGCLYVDEDTSFTVTTENGLSSHIVNTIIGKDNQWFVGTNKGLDVFTFHADTFMVKNYNKFHGLYGNDINKVLLLNDNRLLLVYYKAMDILSLADIQLNKEACQLYLESMSVNNQEVSLTDNLVFSHHQNFIQFEYVGLNYRQRKETPYRYRLIGHEKSWLYTSSNAVQYSSLNPGEYMFEVQIANEDGFWSDSQQLSFQILFPYWQTWWFYLVSVLITVGGLLLAIRFQINQIKYREEVKRQMLELEKQTLKAQMNPHFIFNALNSIYNFILKNEKMLAAKYLTKFANLIRLILNHSKEGVIALQSEIDALTLYLDLEKIRYREKFDYEVIISPEIKKETTLIPTMLIQPFVENSIWHGFKNIDYLGKITIELSLASSRVLTCAVTDNGIGREASKALKGKGHKRKSIGMNVTEKRLQLINSHENAELKITDLYHENQEPAGTRVEFLIYIQKSYESTTSR